MADVGWTAADIPDLYDRVAVVTGANGGLGFETALALATHGAQVVMAARNLERGAAAQARIRAAVPKARLQVVELDTASLDSVRRAAETMRGAHHRIDILVNNAGVMAVPFGLSADGHELQLATNHLGHFALTALLAPALLRSDAGRIVSLTSTGRFLGPPLRAADASMARGYRPWAAYGRAKQAAAQLTVELDRRLVAAGAPARALAADPGFARTDLQARSARESRGWSQRLIEGFVRRLGSTPAHGALPQLRCATDPAARGGALYALRFVIRGGPVRTPYLVTGLGPRDAGEAWAVSERLTGIRFDVHAALREARAG